MNYYKLMSKLDKKHSLNMGISKETLQRMDEALQYAANESHNNIHWMTEKYLVKYSDAVYAKGVILGGTLACIGTLLMMYYYGYFDKKENLENTDQEIES